MSQVNKDCAVQQLYIYAGVLAVSATINSAPLKVLVRVAKVGAVWQVLGQLLSGSHCFSNVSPNCLLSYTMCILYAACLNFFIGTPCNTCSMHCDNAVEQLEAGMFASYIYWGGFADLS